MSRQGDGEFHSDHMKMILQTRSLAIGNSGKGFVTVVLTRGAYFSRKQITKAKAVDWIRKETMRREERITKSEFLPVFREP